MADPLDPAEIERKRIEKLNSDVSGAMGAKAPGGVYSVGPEIQAMRQKFLQSRRGEASQAANQQRDQGQEAIARKFSAMGASGSGAQLSAMERNLAAAEGVRQKGMQEVSGQELQMAESDLGRNFQSSMADRDIQFKQQLSNIDQANKLKGMDMAERQFEMDKATTEFNKQMALLDAEAAGKNTKGLGPGGASADKLINPFGSSLDAIGDAKWLVNPVQSVIGEVSGAVNRAIGTFICTELHSQGFISDEILRLDSMFGKSFKDSGSEAYKGYLIFAPKVVSLMKKSKVFSHIIASIFVPWCYWMGNKYDKNVPNSVVGFLVQKVMAFSMPIVYRLGTTKELSWK